MSLTIKNDRICIILVNYRNDIGLLLSSLFQINKIWKQFVNLLLVYLQVVSCGIKDKPIFRGVTKTLQGVFGKTVEPMSNFVVI